jgi:CDP-diacylglycerol--serine O-phosphatidyltransferase
MKKHIPNTITLLNLASGFISAILASQGEIEAASWMILLAMVFDFLDGFSARALKAYSELGKQLDSLADLVSFGVAPGIIIFTQMKSAMAHHPEAGPALAFLMTWIAVVMPACAALRLAKFNIDTEQSYSFRGLPTPANALAVVSLFLGTLWSGNSLAVWVINYPAALALLTVILSLLMVTRLPLSSLKFRSLRFGDNADRYTIIGVSVILMAGYRYGGPVLLVPAYLAISLAFSIAGRRN